MAVVTQVLLFEEARLVHSRHFEFRGKRRWRRGGGRGRGAEGIAHPNNDWVGVFREAWK